MSESGKAKLDSMVVVVVVFVAAVAVYAGATVYRSRTADTTAPPMTMAAGDAAQHLRQTLDPNLFVGEVKKAYQIAERNPNLLAQMHCYCGCDHQEGHKNLLDCFRDDHGSKCAICVGEARDAEAMAGRGVPVDQIRDTLRARYAGG